MIDIVFNYACDRCGNVGYETIKLSNARDDLMRATEQHFLLMSQTAWNETVCNICDPISKHTFEPVSIVHSGPEWSKQEFAKRGTRIEKGLARRRNTPHHGISKDHWMSDIHQFAEMTRISPLGLIRRGWFDADYQITKVGVDAVLFGGLVRQDPQFQYRQRFRRQIPTRPVEQRPFGGDLSEIPGLQQEPGTSGSDAQDAEISVVAAPVKPNSLFQDDVFSLVNHRPVQAEPTQASQHDQLEPTLSIRRPSAWEIMLSLTGGSPVMLPARKGIPDLPDLDAALIDMREIMKVDSEDAMSSLIESAEGDPDRLASIKAAKANLDRMIRFRLLTGFVSDKAKTVQSQDDISAFFDAGGPLMLLSMNPDVEMKYLDLTNVDVGALRSLIEEEKTLEMLFGDKS